jgi:nitroimidazol reductase NimA-like FMN-containing flavoprotein (pyridoxamine 5'-phosphate oxidase superfamily)
MTVVLPGPIIGFPGGGQLGRNTGTTKLNRGGLAVATTKPTFRGLDRAECETLMAMHHVGRLAFSFHDKVDIEPIHYVWSDGWIYGRTGDGTKLRALARNRWVAFEVDEVSALFDWRSVVVKGSLFILSPSDDGPLHGEWDHAVSLLRRIVPEAFTDDDPTPERAVLFRIQADKIAGRAATP